MIGLPFLDLKLDKPMPRARAHRVTEGLVLWLPVFTSGSMLPSGEMFADA